MAIDPRGADLERVLREGPGGPVPARPQAPTEAVAHPTTAR
jgi:hypothetical protein